MRMLLEVRLSIEDGKQENPLFVSLGCNDEVVYYRNI